MDEFVNPASWKIDWIWYEQIVAEFEIEFAVDTTIADLLGLEEE